MTPPDDTLRMSVSCLRDAAVGQPLALHRKGLTLQVTVVRVNSKHVWVGPVPGGNVRINRWTGRGQGAYVGAWLSSMTEAAEAARWREVGVSRALALVRLVQNASPHIAREVAERVGALVVEMERDG